MKQGVTPLTTPSLALTPSQLDQSNISAEDLTQHLRRILCDRDPSVMGASLCVIEKMTIKNPAPFKDLVPSLVSILKQVRHL